MTDLGKIKTYDNGNGTGTVALERGGNALPFLKADLQQQGSIFSREPGARKRPRLAAPPSMQSVSEMNVNQLLHDHQLAKLKAQHAHSHWEREFNSDLIIHYAQQITAWRRAEGLSETGWPHAQRSCMSCTLAHQ